MFTRLLILLLLSGCTPFIGYEHLSQPNIDDDGYDLICGGVELQKGRYRGDVAVCENLHIPGTYAKIEGRILLGKIDD